MFRRRDFARPSGRKEAKGRIATRLVYLDTGHTPLTDNVGNLQGGLPLAVDLMPMSDSAAEALEVLQQEIPVGEAFLLIMHVPTEHDIGDEILASLADSIKTGHMANCQGVILTSAYEDCQCPDHLPDWKDGDLPPVACVDWSALKEHAEEWGPRLATCTGRDWLCILEEVLGGGIGATW